MRSLANISDCSAAESPSQGHHLYGRWQRVTSLAPDRSRLRLEIGEALTGRSKAELLEHAAMIALLAIWAVPFTRATGGRGVHNELVFAAVLVVLLPAMRAWRAPTRSIIAAALVAAAALLVCVFAPSHWYGSDVAAGYVIAAGAYVGARRYARDDERRLLLATSVCLAGLYQFEQAFLPWWGSRNPSVQMAGTFYWHNPYAAFLLPSAVLGLGLIVTGRRPYTLVGWLSAPLCTAGIVFSSSRATIAALVVAMVLVLALGGRTKRALVRIVGGLAGAALVVIVLPGPPLFPHYAAPWSATEARGSTESLAQNGAYRTQFWRSALEVAAHHPLVGSGFHELANDSAFYTPRDWARSPQAHNGYLQALSDGGLVLGLPFLAAAAVVLWWGLRRMWMAVFARPGPGQVLEVCAALALLALFAHSAVDFDWSHPSILVEVALLGAMVAPVGERRRHARVSAGALAALCAVAAVLVPALHQWQQNQPNYRYSTDRLLHAADATFGDYRPAVAVLRDYTHGRRPLTDAQAARALALTSSQATVDLHVALLRDAVGASMGLYPDAVARARETLRAHGGLSPAFVPDLALVMSSAGERDAAAGLLSDDIAAQVAAGAAAPNLSAELSQWALTLGTGGRYACEVDRATPLLGTAEGLPAPTAPCPRHDQGHG